MRIFPHQGIRFQHLNHTAFPLLSVNRHWKNLRWQDPKCNLTCRPYAFRKNDNRPGWMRLGCCRKVRLRIPRQDQVTRQTQQLGCFIRRQNSGWWGRNQDEPPTIPLDRDFTAHQAIFKSSSDRQVFSTIGSPPKATLLGSLSTSFQFSTAGSNSLLIQFWFWMAGSDCVGVRSMWIGSTL